MSTVFPTRPGQKNLTSNEKALFLRMFEGETMAQFEQNNVLMNSHRVLSIKNGKSQTFPVLGQLTAQYHAIGTFQDGAGQALQQSERTISVDNLLVSHVYIAKIEEALQRADLRGMYSEEMGNALRRAFENRVFRTAVNAARQPSALTGLNPATGKKYVGGGQISLGVATGTAPTAANLRSAFLAACEAFDNKFVPQDSRVCYLPVNAYYQWFNGASAGELSQINRDVGGAGDLNKAYIPSFAGIEIRKTTNLPTLAITAADVIEGRTGASGTENVRVPTASESDVPSVYTGDFTATRGLFMHKDAVATVKLMDIHAEEEYSAPRKSTYLSAQYAMGHGVLRPEAALEIISGGTAGAITNF